MAKLKIVCSSYIRNMHHNYGLWNSQLDLDYLMKARKLEIQNKNHFPRLYWPIQNLQAYNLQLSG